MYRAYCSSLEKMAAAVDGENGETKESTQTLDSEEKEGPKMRKDFKSAFTDRRGQRWKSCGGTFGFG